MKAVLFAVGLSLSGLVLAQDQFPPTPNEVLVEIGLLPKEARPWTYEALARRSVARVLELTGLTKPVDGIILVASGHGDEELLRKVLRHRSDIEWTLHWIPGGFLNALGPEAEGLRAKLQKAWVAIPRLLEARSVAIFPDIPENHTWYEGLANLQMHGLIQEQPGPWRSVSPRSRLFFAVATREACERLPNVAAGIVEVGGEMHPDAPSGWGHWHHSDGLGPLRPPAWRTFATGLIGLQKMVDEFAVELRISGGDPVLMRSSIDRAYEGGFDDVPATHWAASALEALNAKELLKGYPQKGGQVFKGGGP